MTDAFREPVSPHAHRWTRAEYERIVEVGGFGAEARLELLDGDIVDMSPQKSAHASTADLTEAVLRACTFPNAYIRTHKPLAIDDMSEPEPDIAVVPGAPRDYVHAHPSTALLVIEVADSSPGYDRERKARVYARNGIADYWILNLRDQVLEIHRAPQGDAYRRRDTLGPGQQTSPLAAPDCVVRVDELLP
ncbi:Uma2 family endonuclease [uncultured Thiohalocapsa sp.]|uniref:Uma2 family endonuclease n=1 Tax=uncultured Thiohalocapsa sp. TaxID=768990 RepID=UPI0025EC92F3|nr:Uma2 family endonuclease [uncultured Thiohalocapsa sp.]